MSSPSDNTTFANRQEPCNGVEQGRLASSVGTDQSDDLPGRDLEVDRKQGLKISITAACAAHISDGVGHASMPIYTRRTSGSAITSLGAPSAIFWPKLRTMIRSATDIIACRTCSIQTIVIP